MLRINIERLSKMYNPNKTQYIFRQSSGKVWNFYYDDRSGICCSTLNKRNSWTESNLIQGNVHHLFYADMDVEGYIHLIAQNFQGNLVYILVSDGDSKIYPVLNSKNPSCYDKHLSLIPFKGTVHILYTLRHNTSVILAHQILSSGNINTPKVIDYVAESDIPYSSTYDASGNIYVFYQSSDGNYFQTGYKKYNFMQKSWSDFTPITRYNGNTESPCVITDDKNIIHLCYQRRSAKQLDLVYQQKLPDKNIWSNEIIIHSSSYPFENASLILTGSKLIIFWVRDDTIYHCTSDDTGKSWTKASRYQFPAGRQLVCLSYKSNISPKVEKIIAPRIPGTLINGYRLAFYQEPQSTVSDMSAEDLRTMLLDGLKLLKGSVDELKEANINTDEGITKLKALQQSMEKEMIKNSLKLNMLENEVNQLKQVFRKFDDYYEKISNLKTGNNYGNISYEEQKNSLLSDTVNLHASSEENKKNNKKKEGSGRVFRLKKF
ncbi:MAG: hypothetical protein N3I35_12645 [Clostridia bacterium]|nr:hypothetical protein [Clostridia bacterium]